MKMKFLVELHAVTINITTSSNVWGLYNLLRRWCGGGVRVLYLQCGCMWVGVWVGVGVGVGVWV